MLLKLPLSAALPPPSDDKAEEPDVAVLLNITLSTDVGTPGNCQFCASLQLVLILFIASTPLQITSGRTPVGPLVSVRRIALLLTPTKPEYPAGSVPNWTVPPPLFRPLPATFVSIVG